MVPRLGEITGQLSTAEQHLQHYQESVTFDRTLGRYAVILFDGQLNLARMNSRRLFVSFWHVSMDNLPEGIFRRRRLSYDEAKALIEQARQQDTLMCVCDEDLLAPYYKRAREKHEELRDVLSEHFGIHLTIGDFTHKYESDEGNSYHVAPLAIASVGDEGRLLVVTCYYIAEKRKTGRMPPFKIDPESVEFSIFESANNVQGLVAHEVQSAGSVL